MPLSSGAVPGKAFGVYILRVFNRIIARRGVRGFSAHALIIGALAHSLLMLPTDEYVYRS